MSSSNAIYVQYETDPEEDDMDYEPSNGHEDSDEGEISKHLPIYSDILFILFILGPRRTSGVINFIPS